VIDPRPDILPGCFAEDLPLALDPWGPAAATLVEYRGKVPNPGPGGRAILYLHGFNDYFHCSELGPRFAAAGYRFYALDCRGHGRAIRPGRPVSYVAHLSTYFEEIAAAITLLRRRDGCTWVALLGHSTGGLVAPLYVAARNGVDALLLNSPFFAFRAKPALQVVLHIGCPALSLVRPLAELPLEPDARYAWSIHESFGKGGKWDYDLGWKQPGTLPIRAAWVRAVVAGQLRVRRGLDLRCPVHVMASDRRGLLPRLDEERHGLGPRFVHRRGGGPRASRHHLSSPRGDARSGPVDPPGPRGRLRADDRVSRPRLTASTALPWLRCL
jgi:alpha-beta hydrolase superfamily lysophospholipase